MTTFDAEHSTPVSVQSVRVDGPLALSVATYAISGPPVVLIHGGAMNRSNWDTVIPALVGAGLRPVALDMRACGESDRDFERMDVPTLGDDVVRVMDALELASAAVIGWSVGGAVAVSAAHALGSRLERLVLIAAAAPPMREGAGHPGLPAEAFDAVVQALADDRVEFWRGMSLILFSKSRPELSERCWQLFTSSGERFDETLGGLKDLDQHELLPAITAPTLICHGRHDMYVPLVLGEVLCAELPNARLRVFEQSGHTPFLEEPDAFRRELLDFLSDAGTRSS